MNITLLYGPGESQKRQHLLKIKREFDPGNIVTVDLKNLPSTELERIVQLRSLLSVGPRLIVVENTPEKLDLATVGGAEDTSLVLVAGGLKETSPLLKSTRQQKVQVIFFDSIKEVSAFPFVDALMAGRKEALRELETLYSEYGWVYIFSMIYYGLRRNLLPPPTSAFSQKKIKEQKIRFNDSDWPKLYKRVLESEFKIKSGLGEGWAELNRLTSYFTLRSYGG